MNTDFSAITKAPDGYEWVYNAHGEIQQRVPLADDFWVKDFSDGQWTVGWGRDWHSSVTRLIVRKVPPPVKAYDVTVRVSPAVFEFYKDQTTYLGHPGTVISDAINNGKFTEVRE